jgi:hypothetical protein
MRSGLLAAAMVAWSVPPSKIRRERTTKLEECFVQYIRPGMGHKDYQVHIGPVVNDFFF